MRFLYKAFRLFKICRISSGLIKGLILIRLYKRPSKADT